MIPSLVVCDSEGRVLTNKGKEDLMSSPKNDDRSIKQVIRDWDALYEDDNGDKFTEAL